MNYKFVKAVNWFQELALVLQKELGLMGNTNGKHEIMLWHKKTIITIEKYFLDLINLRIKNAEKSKFMAKLINFTGNSIPCNSKNLSVYVRKKIINKSIFLKTEITAN